ncbi:MAG: hypothetical protein JWP01_3911 [Myxococcales bacterium]|nr:hypothetical protein [Myxococcales bacterium]
MAVAQRWSRTEPWPTTERATAIAQRKIADLTRDPRLAELLARELTRWAQRWWDARRDRHRTGGDRLATW